MKAETKRFKTRAQALAAIDDQLRNANVTYNRHRVDITRRCRNGITLSFNTKHQIVEIKVPPRAKGRRYFLETAEEVNDHFQDIREAWESVTRRTKIFFVIDYENFDVNPICLEEYVKLANAFFADSSLSVVRYNANLLQSTTIRYTTMNGAKPVNLFKARADAIAVVEGMQDGRVEFSDCQTQRPRTAKCDNGIMLTFEHNTQVLELQMPAPKPGRIFLIDTPAEVRRYLQDVAMARAELTGSKPVYWLVNYQHFSVNPEVRPALDKDIGDLLRVAAIALVRYNITLPQSIALRRGNATGRFGVQLYASRDEAVRAIEKMRGGRHIEV